MNNYQQPWPCSLPSSSMVHCPYTDAGQAPSLASHRPSCQTRWCFKHAVWNFGVLRLTLKIQTPPTVPPESQSLQTNSLRVQSRWLSLSLQHQHTHSQNLPKDANLYTLTLQEEYPCPQCPCLQPLCTVSDHTTEDKAQAFIHLQRNSKPPKHNPRQHLTYSSEVPPRCLSLSRKVVSLAATADSWCT